MDHRNNFETVTKLTAFKKNAVQLCGKEFINTLTKRNLHFKDNEFWYEVNQKLGIPNDAYEQMLIKQQEEKERIQEEKERIQAEQKAERDRLMENKILISERITKEHWNVKLFETFESTSGKKYYFAEVIKLDETLTTIEILTTDFFDKKQKALNQADYLIDKFEQEQIRLHNAEVLKSIYLMYLYLSGDDVYSDDPEKPDSKETFRGIESWVKSPWKILAKLDEEGLIKQPQRVGNHKKEVTYIAFTKEGMQAAREALQKVNLEGLDILLKDREYHEEYFS